MRYVKCKNTDLPVYYNRCVATETGTYFYDIDNEIVLFLPCTQKYYTFECIVPEGTDLISYKKVKLKLVGNNYYAFDENDKIIHHSYPAMDLKDFKEEVKKVTGIENINFVDYNGLVI